MTDVQVPRCGMGPGPITLPAIAWYEFILDEKLLEEHLKKDNPDPSPVDLIIQFLQQADVELTNAALNKEQQQQRAITPQPLIYEPKPDTNGKVLEENKKVKALRLLAMKVAAHLKWNMNVLEKGVPLPVSQTLLVELLRMTMGDLMVSAKDPDLDLSTLSDEAAFAVHLYHRWCLHSVVKDSFPCRPPRQVFFPIPGQVDPAMAMAAATEAICNGLRDELSTSITILQHLIDSQSHLRMPTPQCFAVPSENSDVQFNWTDAISIPREEVIAQVTYDLGSVLFHKSEYKQAFELFRRSQEVFDKLNNPVYCCLNAARLKGYLVSCTSLLGVTRQASLSLYERAEASRKNNFRGLVDVFLEDNLKKELNMVYRSNIEDELSRCGRSLFRVYTEVVICNVVRGVLDGKALVSPILDILENTDHDVVLFLVRVISDVMKGASFKQRPNLKCFIWHLVEMSPTECGLTNVVLKSGLATYFDRDERTEMVLGEEGDEMYLEDFEMDESTCTTISSVSSQREMSYNINDIEGRLLTVYDPDMIKDLVKELHSKQNWKLVDFVNLNDKWKVTREIRRIIDGMSQFGLQQCYIYVLLGKARHCMDLKIFERARQLLGVVDNTLGELTYAYVISKHVRWQALLCDLLQYYLNQSFGEGSTLQDLVKKTKTCLTTIRLGQDIQPSDEVLEQCTAFLLNIRDWDYLTNLENSANGYIEVSRLMACACRELPMSKTARKLARDFWEAVIKIFQTNSTQKRSNSGRDSAIHRDQQIGILSRDAFLTYIYRIKEPTILTLMISMLTKLFTMLKDEITSEISSEYLGLWPTVVNNISTMSIQSVEDALTALMEHALEVCPTQTSWLRTQADIYFANSQYSSAMKYYLEAGVVATDFFTRPFTKTTFDDQIYRKMIKCCSYLQCHTQVALLCQFLDDVDYTTAFKSLQERNTYDAMDAYYCCIWDVSMLEYLIHLHTKRGETEKRQSALRALSQIDVNSSNPEEVQRRAVCLRKNKFLRALAKQYLT
ncbi:integrator complex subunit 8-like [Gigantopelta aegis]|uniref:integrator complex subunit 8-like n=1 Tax=Gigantopelta aegis TaxID=1735272 RepID=UPI001B88D26A|nr:integrator complex subunit 8-like [Gigantopelta aegis]